MKTRKLAVNPNPLKELCESIADNIVSDMQMRKGLGEIWKKISKKQRERIVRGWAALACCSIQGALRTRAITSLEHLSENLQTWNYSHEIFPK